MKITRRLFATLLISIAPLFLFSAPPNPAKNPSQYLVFIGTYTNKTASKGIYSAHFDAATGQLTQIQVAAETEDPSFLAIAPNKNYLYAVNELSTFEGNPSGAVTAYKINSHSAKLTKLNQQPSGGPGPCYISLDQTGKFALVANYDGGSIAVFPVAPNGQLAKASAFVQHHGSGPNKERQEAPHAHWIAASPDNRFALAVDLGLDEVLIYRFDQTKGTLTPNGPPFVKLQPGSGPRHLAFHPNGKFVYVLNEIKSTITTFAYDPQTATLSPLQTLSTLPPNFTGPNDTAEIVLHPSAKFLYVSNRGHDSVALFNIESAKGTLTLAGDYSTKGKTPRNFALDPTGKFLLAANQETNTIIVFQIDQSTGALTITDEPAQIPAPVDIAFVPFQ